MRRDDSVLLRAEGLSRRYQRGRSEVWALREATLEIGSGEFVSIVGPSGSGKSTLLHLLACLDRPTTGRYWFRETELGGLPDSRLALIRNRFIGIVFQSFNLLPGLSAWQNVALPLNYAGVPRTLRRRKALEALERVGLAHRSEHRPHELSGGEEQRVAIARALVTEPVLFLADEPTGNLDTASQDEFMGIVHSLRGTAVSVCMVTHNPALAEQADRCFHMLDGCLRDNET